MAEISIIIPVLNGVAYIRECLDSITKQTFSDIEIIPVDGGSTDGTVEIIEEYATKDTRIRLLHSEKRSMGYQYNLGISAAKGRYIGFCESDDYVSATMYENLYQIAKINDLDYVRSDFDMFIDKDERIFLNYHILAGNRKAFYERVIRPSDYPDILHRDVNMWNGIYKKEFLHRNQIKANETVGAAFQDIGFVMQTFLAAERAMYVQEKTYRYRRDNIGSSVYDLKGVVNVVQEAEFSEEYLTRLGISDGYIRAVIFHRFCSLFFGFYGKLSEEGKIIESVKRAIISFQEIAGKAYLEIPYYAAAFEGIEKSLSLNYLLKDLGEFDTLRKRIDEIERKSFYKFYKYIVSYPRAVIFGAGEIGTSIYAMFRKNDYEGVSCFVDNDCNKWGENLMGKEILPPSKLTHLNDGKTAFIIAMAAQSQGVKEQLLGMGISGKDICKGNAVIPHNAMEMNIRGIEGEAENEQKERNDSYSIFYE